MIPERTIAIRRDETLTATRRAGSKSCTKIQIQVQTGSLETTSLGVKVQKQNQDQAWDEIHLKGKDARSDNEAARRTEDPRQVPHHTCIEDGGGVCPKCELRRQRMEQGQDMVLCSAGTYLIADSASSLAS
ncbi:hypothetical protein MRX96_014542 [Rhipicephalus microplus]